MKWLHLNVDMLLTILAEAGINRAKRVLAQLGGGGGGGGGGGVEKDCKPFLAGKVVIDFKLLGT